MNIMETFRKGMDRDVNEFLPFLPLLPVLNLGAGKKLIDGTMPLDIDRGWKAPLLPYGNEEVGGAVAFHFMEHLAKDDAIKMIQEVERVLAPGGVFNMVTPYWMSEMAYQDLDHKTFWTENTFRNLFNNPYYDGTMPRNWKFKVQTCLIMGVVHRNLALVTQLVKS